MLSLNQEHMKIFNRAYEDKYIKQLQQYLKEEGSVITDFASELFYYLKENGIDDDRCVRGIAKLCGRDHVSAISQIKENIRAEIEYEQLSGQIKAEKLLIRELGYLPR